ncbi:hypothetical protein [Arthrobacter sp. D3-16]
MGSNTKVNGAKQAAAESIGTTAGAFAGDSDKMGAMSARTLPALREEAG